MPIYVRGLLKYVIRFEKTSVDDIINNNPFKIQTTATVSEMISFIKSIKASILFLPVVDENNVLKGVVTFNNLIKGE